MRRAGKYISGMVSTTSLQMPWWKTMDSSLAVFSTLGSPFLEASSSRSHYHPSRAQPLRQKQQQTVLSPSRLQHRNCSILPEEAEPGPSYPHLLPDSNSQEGKPPKSNSTSPFNESWPSTERSSSSLTPEGTKGLPAQQSSEAKTLDVPKLPDSVSDSESVIAKYIERFRYGKPTDRKERLTPSGGSTEFWWLNHPFLPDGENSRKEASLSSDNSQSEVRSSLFSPILTHSPLGEMQAASALDAETVSLQEKAARLLCRSMSPLSSSRPVSSEGLGSTSTSTITNSATDLPQHALQRLAAHQAKDSLSISPYHITPSSVSHSSKPEDDILFQWRLRRKMEEASKAVAVRPPEVWRSPCIQPTCASGKMEREVLKSAEPTHWRSEDQKVLQTSEPQLDVKYTLNLCHPSCAGILRNGITSGQSIETIPISNGIMVTGGPECSGEHIVKKSTPQEDHIPDYLSTSPPRPAETSEPLDQATSCHVQGAAPSDQGVRLEPRRRPGLCRVKQSQAKSIPDPRESPHSPTKHSVQHVLAEVVAERLFSPPESPALHRDKPKRSSRTLGPGETIPKKVVTPSHPQLLNMAAQLLEQAEDSDGMEFEDDPLLQVLRGQRESLHHQLRAVDFQITQLESNSFDQGISHH